MFGFAKKLVKNLEQSVNETINTINTRNNTAISDQYFQSIPEHLLIRYYDSTNNLKVITNVDQLYGLRVLQTDTYQLQLTTFFDYIIGINDQPIPVVFNEYGYMVVDYNAIYKILNELVLGEKEVKLNVWSGKGGFYREEYVTLEPNSEVQEIDISSDENNNPIFLSLGFKVQWQPLIAATYVYHILSIQDNNINKNRLVANTDYIIGCQQGLLCTGGEKLLYNILQSKQNQEIELYVYNSDHDVVRNVLFQLDDRAKLGCNVGYGYLHRIPIPKEVQQKMLDELNNQEDIKSENILSIPLQQDNKSSIQVSEDDLKTEFKPLSFEQQISNANNRKKHHDSKKLDSSLLSQLQEPEETVYKTEEENASIPPPPIINKG
ncbi:uncharacterized protein HGUI_01774 [Hanseniaspora guilliermondii]|uniref:PDZ GRASP-type domain-containing protein n=1 Tax=Hanseniaspora guilliermondii TaxID=56406 RepID=A0A1L0FIZ0_9ASCO|nr:uncharacterized protein HGUI_01774 [Hanseniaspora guilliermondii]